MPSPEELGDYYKGFLFSADPGNINIVVTSGSRLFEKIGLPRDSELKMLDVGGGGGFYAKAFETAGYGQSTYVDLDSDACSFAKETVGLSRVLNKDATEFLETDQKFDFIMCRHLIEHLVEPTSLILKLVSLLSDKGVLLVVCPNGDSLEYLAHPQSNLQQRIESISRSSRISRLGVLGKFLSGKMLHGLDPPRHLWAISRRGMRAFLKDHNLNSEITTFPLTDPDYSPYFKKDTFGKKVSAFFGNNIAARVAGGTHLSVIVRKSAPGGQRHAD